MENPMTIKELKIQQKARAAKIKADRAAHKSAQSQGLPSPVPWGGWGLHLAGNEYRLHHIAYCMSRGTPYELIEPKVREGNEPRWDKIDAIRATLTAEIPEVVDAPVCIGA
jgi:hypothetical protein